MSGPLRKFAIICTAAALITSCSHHQLHHKFYEGHRLPDEKIAILVNDERTGFQVISIDGIKPSSWRPPHAYDLLPGEHSLKVGYTHHEGDYYDAVSVGRDQFIPPRPYFVERHTSYTLDPQVIGFVAEAGKAYVLECSVNLERMTWRGRIRELSPQERKARRE